MPGTTALAVIVSLNPPALTEDDQKAPTCETEIFDLNPRLGPPALTDGRRTSCTCQKAYHTLWNWDVDTETIEDFSPRLSPPWNEPSLDDCVTVDQRWKEWTRSENIAELFDTMQTWKWCASQFEGYETWEECREDDLSLCTSLEFQRRLIHFGIKTPGQCADNLPECAKLMATRPDERDTCWEHYLKIEGKCGKDDRDKWKLQGCGQHVDACIDALVEFEQAERGNCLTPYDRLVDKCPQTVIDELKVSSNECMKSLQTKFGEECNGALLAYATAPKDQCASKANNVQLWCDQAPDWVWKESFNAIWNCAQICEDQIEKIPSRPYCRISDKNACGTRAQRKQLLDAQNTCAARNRRMAFRYVLPSAIGFGVFGAGGVIIGSLYHSYGPDSQKPWPTSTWSRIGFWTGGVTIAVGVVLGGASLGLMMAGREKYKARQRSGTSSRQAATVIVTTLLSGQPISF